MPDDTQPLNPTEQAVEQSHAEAAEPVVETAQPQVEQQAPQESPVQQPVDVDNEAEFRKGYQELVARTNHSISVEPKYTRRDDGTYSTTLETTVQPVK